MFKNNEKKKRGFVSIKLKLVATIIPFIIIGMLIILNFTYRKAQEIIVDYGKGIVDSITVADAKEFETWSGSILSELNQIKNTIENVPLSEVELLNYLKSTMNRNDRYKNGVYIGFSNNKMLEPSGAVLGNDYIVTETKWYKEGQKNEEGFRFGETYLDENTGEYVVSATAKLQSGYHSDGVVSANISLGTIADIVTSKSMLDGKIFLIDSSNNNILSNEDISLIHTTFDQSSSSELVQAISKTVNLSENNRYDVVLNGNTHIVSVQSIENTPWKVIGYVSHSEVLSVLESLQYWSMGLFIVSVIIICIVYERIVHIHIKPIEQLTKTINTIASGDFSVDINVKGNDEIAEMSGSMRTFVENMRDTIQSVGDISKELGLQATNSSQIVQELNHSAETQSTSMSELNQTVDELARAVSEIAENTTELSTVVAQTSQNGQEASVKMKNTVLVSEKGKTDMGQVSIAMDNLNTATDELLQSVKEVDESTEKINSIVQLIGGISDQTNLLSLNAAIEAARAGEAGKGFAVVASEIRNLAETSQSSVNSITALTNNIKNLVNNTIQKTQESANHIKYSMDLVTTAETTFGDIYNTVNETNDIVQNMIEKVSKVDEVATYVAAITEEQSAAAEEILATSESLTYNAQKVADNSHIVEMDAAKLTESAEYLNKQMQVFKM